MRANPGVAACALGPPSFVHRGVCVCSVCSRESYFLVFLTVQSAYAIRKRVKAPGGGGGGGGGGCASAPARARRAAPAAPPLSRRVPRAAAHGAKSNRERDDQTILVIIRVSVFFIPTPLTQLITKGVFAAGA